MSIPTTRMANLPLQALGGQLAMMQGLLDRAKTAVTVNEYWPTINALCERRGITISKVGNRPDNDEAAFRFMQRFRQTLQPGFNGSVIALTEKPTPAVLHWQQLNVDELTRYANKDIISFDAATRLITAAETYLKEMVAARKRFTLGERITILSEYLDAHIPHAEDLVANIRTVLYAYGLSPAIIAAAQIIDPDKVMTYRMRLLELIQPKIKSEIMQYVTDLPTRHTLERIGLSDKILIKAGMIGIITEQEVVKLSGLTNRLAGLADSAAQHATAEDALREMQSAHAHSRAISTGIILSAIAANVGGAALFVANKSAFNAIPLIANAVVFGLMLLMNRGIIFKRKKPEQAEPVKTKKVVITAQPGERRLDSAARNILPTVPDTSDDD